jgi:hypothetical protein
LVVHTRRTQLRVYENRVLWRIFGPKREKWQDNGEDCNEELYSYASLNIIKVMK